MNIWTKRPAESYAEAVEFVGRLPTGSSLVSGVAVAINRATGADATATVLEGAVAISATRAIIKGKAGTSPTDYLITLTVTLDDGSVLVEEILFQVRLAMLLIATPGAIDANSYCTRVEADAYHQTHLYNDVWLVADDWRKEAALMMATRILDDQVDWSGTVANLTQALRWPRYGVVDRDGVNYFDKASIPVFLKRATAEFARWLLTEDRTVERGFGISSVTADTVKVDFDKFDVKPIIPAVVTGMIVQYGRVSGPGSMTVPLVRA